MNQLETSREESETTSGSSQSCKVKWCISQRPTPTRIDSTNRTLLKLRSLLYYLFMRVPRTSGTYAPVCSAGHQPHPKPMSKGDSRLVSSFWSYLLRRFGTCKMLRRCSEWIFMVFTFLKGKSFQAGRGGSSFWARALEFVHAPRTSQVVKHRLPSWSIPRRGSALRKTYLFHILSQSTASFSKEAVMTSFARAVHSQNIFPHNTS